MERIDLDGSRDFRVEISGRGQWYEYVFVADSYEQVLTALTNFYGTQGYLSRSNGVVKAHLLNESDVNITITDITHREP